jgi:colanic acid/amylovoran biosynthesis glycosyltransferase
MWKFPAVSETFILAQIATAIKAGLEVKILINDKPEVLDNSIHHEFIEKYELRNKVIFENLGIPENKFRRLFMGFWLLIRNFRYAHKIYRYFQHKKFRDLNIIFEINFYKNFRKYDLIHIQYGTNAKPIDLLKKIGLLKSTIIVSFHGHDLFFPINGFIRNENYYDVLFAQADRLIANTPYLENLLLDLGAFREKLITIPVGVDNEFFSPCLDEEKTINEIRLISVGRLVKFKGHINGILSVKNLRDKGYNVLYTIIGSGDQLQTLNEAIRKNKLTENVKLLGTMSSREIRDNLRLHDLFLMTSVTDPNYGVETQGLVTAEAQACGLPVIAFDSGGVKYTLQDGISGFLVKEGDIEAMTNKLERLINDNILRKKMSKSGIKFINEEYSQKHIDKKWMEEYYKLINDL